MSNLLYITAPRVLRWLQDQPDERIVFDNALTSCLVATYATDQGAVVESCGAETIHYEGMAKSIPLPGTVERLIDLACEVRDAYKRPVTAAEMRGGLQERGVRLPV